MNKLTAFIAAFALVAANFAAVVAQNATAKTSAPANDLVALLPASDIVAVADLRRLTTDALPQIFASKPATLAEINQHFDAFKAKTGIDPRQFDRVAVGVKYDRAVAGKIDFAPVAVTRGNFNANGLLGVAKIGLSGKYREEKIGNQNLLVVSLKDVAAQMPQPKDPAKADQISKIISKLMTGEVAFHAVDQTTLAFGDLKQVRAMVEAKTKNGANADLASLASRNPNAVLSFAANVPGDLQSLMRFDNDEIGNILASLRHAFGSLDVTGGNANVMFAARTETADQARNLKDTLLGLQSLSGLLRARKGAKNEVIADIAESLKISQTANEIELRALIPKTALDKLLAGK
ncbi:MAG: hypothetical protein M3209_03520 [Acidobacteriota bacterium]|nr:hypothetical protein [Acidobacteriota bacterium]